MSCGPSSRKALPFIIHFQDSKTGKLARGTPRRRGPLKEGSREEMRVLKSEGGACWRCKILKKQVGIYESAFRCSIMLINCSVIKDYHVRHAPQGSQNHGSLNVSKEGYRIG